MMSRFKPKTPEQISVTSRFSAVALTVALLMMSNLSHADATAPCNAGPLGGATECGVNASAAGSRSTAVGADASAAGNVSTAVGNYASAAGSRSTAVGTGASATGDFSTTVGSNAASNSANSTRLGFAAGFNGGVSNTDSPASIAIGYFANINPTSPGAIAIGGSLGPNISSTRGAQADGENAIAIGFEARANQPGSIALGANVVADKANTMTVGVPIEVVRNDGTTQILVNEKSAGNAVRTLFNVVCDTCTPGFRFNQTLPSNNTWNFRMLQSGSFSVDDPATGGKEVEFRSGGDLKIGGTLIQASSRAIKTDFIELNNIDILKKIEQLPITQWSYKKDHGTVKHIGPMAEDFYALFDVGLNNKGLSSVDTAGVALAAIKALREEKDHQINTLQSQLKTMQSQLAELKQRLTDSVALNQSEQVATTITN